MKKVAPGLPIAGYRPQSAEVIAAVNAHKVTEEMILRHLDGLDGDQFDRRWLAVARTHFELGFMALNRAVLRPERIKLEGDE
ncbi:Acb2/Tad1 domain-containing protein [Mesorhizobium sp. 2RAF21]|uniref:Acb2/Tad1 domain-containing protein n=1 Tax=Mesorhizobium sp. 2RAF21 TaxID=3232995 RepID=UPI003F954003